MKRKALLVVSFGTTYADTRERTIGAIEGKLAERFPDRDVVRAWTSGFIIKKIAKTEGLAIDTPEQALEKLAARGVTDLIIQPTHLADGYENQRMLQIIRSYAGRFERLAVGRPLLSTEADRRQVARFIERIRPGKALLLMGHGSKKHPVPVYRQLQEEFFRQGAGNIFVAAVEGEPSFEEAEKLLRESGCREVILTPLMIVAGEHARNDLAGEGPDSWQSRLKAGGFETEVILSGLGEYAEIQEMFARHAGEARPADQTDQ